MSDELVPIDDYLPGYPDVPAWVRDAIVRADAGRLFDGLAVKELAASQVPPVIINDADGGAFELQALYDSGALDHVSPDGVYLTRGKLVEGQFVAHKCFRPIWLSFNELYELGNGLLRAFGEHCRRVHR